MALKEIAATLAELPPPLRERAQSLPVIFEPAPSPELQADGITADTLGLFTGAEFADENTAIMPPQITLFLENLWDFSEKAPEIYCEEIRTTFLHELGHYFGLEEDGLAARGLD